MITFKTLAIDKYITMNNLPYLVDTVDVLYSINITTETKLFPLLSNPLFIILCSCFEESFTYFPFNTLPVCEIPGVQYQLYFQSILCVIEGY